MLTCFSDLVDSRFRTQDVELIFARIIKYFVPFLEASHSILLPHRVIQCDVLLSGSDFFKLTHIAGECFGS